MKHADVVIIGVGWMARSSASSSRPERSRRRHRCSEVDAVVNRTALAMPPAVTAETVMGFTLYMVKAVFDGPADDLVDLAHSNLWT